MAAERKPAEAAFAGHVVAGRPRQIGHGSSVSGPADVNACDGGARDGEIRAEQLAT